MAEKIFKKVKLVVKEGSTNERKFVDTNYQSLLKVSKT